MGRTTIVISILIPFLLLSCGEMKENSKTLDSLPNRYHQGDDNLVFVKNGGVVYMVDELSLRQNYEQGGYPFDYEKYKDQVKAGKVKLIDLEEDQIEDTFSISEMVETLYEQRGIKGLIERFCMRNTNGLEIAKTISHDERMTIIMFLCENGYHYSPKGMSGEDFLYRP